MRCLRTCRSRDSRSASLKTNGAVGRPVAFAIIQTSHEEAVRTM